jgi:hypothetical protein
VRHDGRPTPRSEILGEAEGPTMRRLLMPMVAAAFVLGGVLALLVWPGSLRAVLAWMIALLAVAVAAPRLVRRLPAAWRHLGFLIFGQRDRDARAPTWVPGAGGHGSGGGQAPPHVPYNPDWDPKKRIR